MAVAAWARGHLSVRDFVFFEDFAMSFADVSSESDSGPNAEARRRDVRLRVNAAGKRIIGVISLVERHNRASDLLNEPSHFFTLRDDGEGGGGDQPDTLLRKSAISYVEIVNEPERLRGLVPAGDFRFVTVQLRRPSIVMEGELFVSAEVSVEDVLNDTRPFLNLRSVAIRDSRERYSYLAVGKDQIISVALRSSS